MKTPQKLFEELCEKAAELFTFNPNKQIKSEFNKPGGFIKRQSKEDRELLEKLTSEDVQNAKVLRTDLYTDSIKPTELEKMHEILESKFYK